MFVIAVYFSCPCVAGLCILFLSLYRFKRITLTAQRDTVGTLALFVEQVTLT